MADFKPGDKVIMSGRFFFDAMGEWVEVDGHPARVVDPHPGLIGALRIVSATYGTADVMESAVRLVDLSDHVATVLTFSVTCSPATAKVLASRTPWMFMAMTGVEDVQTSIQEIHQHVTEEVRHG